MGKLKNVSQFISELTELYGELYDYSKVDYKGNKVPVIIICKKHGEFSHRPDNLLHLCGCPECTKKKRADKLRKPLNIFVSESLRIHNSFYRYDKFLYISSSIPGTITCPIHGDFEQTPSSHLRGCGCPKCRYIKSSRAITGNKIEFIDRAKSIHGHTYLYDKVVYIKSHSKICIVCPKHGSFFQTPSDHLQGYGCPSCNASKGEILIKEYLDKNNISYKQQYKIPECKNINPLPFDFAIFNKDGSLRCLIEYQGEQHYRPISWFGGKERFESQKVRDNIKRKYCLDRKIKLIEVNFQDNIYTKLKKLEIY